MSKPTVLLYGFDSGESKKIKTICTKLDIRLRKVQPEEYGQPVGAFVGAEKFLEKMEAGSIPGQMLLFAHVTDRQLEVFLNALRTVRVGVDSLKAVLTQTNAKWTGTELYAELKKEREELGDKP